LIAENSFPLYLTVLCAIEKVRLHIENILPTIASSIITPPFSFLASTQLS